MGALPLEEAEERRTGKLTVGDDDRPDARSDSGTQPLQGILNQLVLAEGGFARQVAAKGAPDQWQRPAPLGDGRREDGEGGGVGQVHQDRQPQAPHAARAG